MNLQYQPGKYQVKIEFLRIQTFLFTVPRLKDMVGANALLGETIRETIPKRAKNAIDIGHAFPDLLQQLPQSDINDPLHQATSDLDQRDDPRHQYCQGILARDGGHFTAVFLSEDKAGEFAREAEELLLTELPGLRFEIQVSPLVKKDNEKTACRSHAYTLLDLPQFQVCQESGNGPASDQVRYPREMPRWISLPVKMRKAKGDEFLDGRPTSDIVGLLRKQIPPTGIAVKEPADLEALCAGDYLAVIHADGNGVGKRFNKWLENSNHPKDPPDERSVIAKEICAEQFFHSMRVAVRRALLDALKAVFSKATGVRPYQLLMLGGDDLLMVCRAANALPIVVEYARALEKYSLVDGSPLTIGAGVVIASHNLPFHHLNHLAETLTSSAKRLYRGLENKNTKVSVVDWLVNTASWADDPLDVRRRDELIRYSVDGRNEAIALSAKPYPILNGTVQGCNTSLSSLEDLLRAAETLAARRDQGRAARSQLRRLTYELPRGRLWGELLFQELPRDTRETLTEAGMKMLWHEIGNNRWATVLADLVELYEIGHLAQRDKNRSKQTREATA